MGTRELFEDERSQASKYAGGTSDEQGLTKQKRVLAHCDGGARGNPGPAGYGAVITDESGAKLAELSEYLGKRTNNHAEYSGLLGVLQWSLDHGVSHLQVVSDSELMVKQVQGRYKVNSPDLRPLFEEARRRISRLNGFQISHALRHKNKDADRLANEAMDRGTGRAPQASQERAVPVARVEERGRAEVRSTGSAALQPSPAGGASRERPAPEVRGEMLRGFVRDGVVHLLGGKALPEGSFVKVLPE